MSGSIEQIVERLEPGYLGLYSERVFSSQQGFKVAIGKSLLDVQRRGDKNAI